MGKENGVGRGVPSLSFNFFCVNTKYKWNSTHIQKKSLSFGPFSFFIFLTLQPEETRHDLNNLYHFTFFV